MNLCVRLIKGVKNFILSLLIWKNLILVVCLNILNSLTLFFFGIHVWHGCNTRSIPSNLDQIGLGHKQVANPITLLLFLRAESIWYDPFLSFYNPKIIIIIIIIIIRDKHEVQPYRPPQVHLSHVKKRRS